MPLFDGVLPGNNAGAQRIAILQEFHEISLLPVSNAMQSPVVQRQHIGAAQLFEHVQVATLLAGICQQFQEAMQTVIHGPKVFQVCLMGQGTRHLIFAHASGTGNQHILPLPDPLTTCQMKHHLPIQSPRNANVKGCHADLQSQLCCLSSSG